jgi:hypothetical protein
LDKNISNLVTQNKKYTPADSAELINAINFPGFSIHYVTKTNDKFLSFASSTLVSRKLVNPFNPSQLSWLIIFSNTS